MLLRSWLAAWHLRPLGRAVRFARRAKRSSAFSVLRRFSHDAPVAGQFATAESLESRHLLTTINLASLGTAAIGIFGADSDDQSGRSVKNAGDINGDGFDDFVIGARYADSANNLKGDAGEAYLIFGGTSLPATTDLRNLGNAGVTFFGEDPNDQCGFAVSGAGDVNGDGFEDLLIGAPEADGSGNFTNRAGTVYLIFWLSGITNHDRFGQFRCFWNHNSWRSRS